MKYRVRECSYKEGTFYAEKRDGFFDEWTTCFRVSRIVGLSRFEAPAMEYDSVEQAEKAIEEYIAIKSMPKPKKRKPYCKEYTPKG